MSYQIRRPSPGRPAFAILERNRKAVGKEPKYKTLVNPEVNELNRKVKSGDLDVKEAERLVKNVVKHLYLEREKGKPQELFTADNFKVWEEFNENDYQFRDLIDPYAGTRDYLRAIQTLGHVSIRTDPKPVLLKQVMVVTKGDPNRQRRVVSRLNTLLNYLKRDFKLPRVKREPIKNNYLTISEFQEVLKVVKNEKLRALYGYAFATGCRLGECLVGSPLSGGAFVHVDYQIDKDGVQRQTKTNKTRRAPVIKSLSLYVDALAALTPVERLAMERSKLSAKFKIACRAANVREVRFHDLRHSYAVHLLGKGVSLSLTAQALGNSIQVCQEYYAGFELSNETLDLVAGKI